MWTTKDMPDQSGKTFIVTGATTGIGFETAKALYVAGAEVVITYRELSRGQKALKEMMKTKGAGSLVLMELKLDSLQSVETFAEQFIASHTRLHGLINNAGVMSPPPSKTAEGYELQFGVNFLGHFALTGLLYPMLKSTEGARVVTVSSLAYLNGAIDFENLKIGKDYNDWREYAQSKLADILFTIELQRRIDNVGDNVVSNASHPGATATELSRNMSGDAYEAAINRLGPLMDGWQGALPSLYAATMKNVKGELIGPDQDNGIRGYPALSQYADNALDRDTAEHLFNLAIEVTGVNFP